MCWGKLMMRMGVVGVVMLGLTGCVTVQTAPPVPVDDDRFDGLWKGSGSLNQIQASGYRCWGSDKPIYFRVKDRVATSLINQPSSRFSVQVAQSGGISFEYKNTVVADGVPIEMRTQFWGDLDGASGGGTYRFSECLGKWFVSKISGSRKKTEHSPYPSSSPLPGKRAAESAKGYQKPYIVIQSNDVVQSGGKPKFKVRPGDILESEVS